MNALDATPSIVPVAAGFAPPLRTTATSPSDEMIPFKVTGRHTSTLHGGGAALACAGYATSPKVCWPGVVVRVAVQFSVVVLLVHEPGATVVAAPGAA